MQLTLEATIRACVGCSTVAPGNGRWLRADDYEGVGVCAECAALTADWDRSLIDSGGVARALKALGHDEREVSREAVKVAQRIGQRVLWFSLSGNEGSAA